MDYLVVGAAVDICVAGGRAGVELTRASAHPDVEVRAVEGRPNTTQGTLPARLHGQTRSRRIHAAQRFARGAEPCLEQLAGGRLRGCFPSHD